MHRHVWWYALGLLVVLMAVVLLVGRSAQAPGHPETTSPPAPSQAAMSVSTSIAHIFIIVEENQPFGTIVGNAQAPYINRLIKQSGLATNYVGISHPSLPNYLALTSGSTQGVTSDCSPPSAGCELNVTNIADRTEGSGRSWKAYIESMPSQCYPYNSGEYATKHNPFVYYADVITNPSRCDSHVVSFASLSDDLAHNGSTPNLAFITPNLCDDMHDCSVAVGDNWLAEHVPAILQSPAFTTQKSLLFITFDEGTDASNQVATIIAGSGAKSAYVSNKPYNHYSLLHTIEAVWELTPLTSNDANAPIMTEFIN